MSLLDEAALKQRDLMAADQGFSKAPRKLQESYFNSLYMTAYVNEIEITPVSDNGILVMIDNRVFGKFKHLRIIPLHSKDNKRLSFNLRTFLKVE